MLSADLIAEFVEKKFKTPVSCKTISESSFKYRLDDLDRNEGFYVVMERNWRRISFKTVLEPFSKPFLKEIDRASVAKKELFYNLFQAFSKNSSLILSINKNEMDINDFRKNRSEIKDFQIESLIKNIDFNEANRNEINMKSADSVLAIFCLMMVYLHKKVLDNENLSKEGSVVERLVKQYERNPIYGEIVKALKGAICCVCDFRFEDRYGDHGKEFIEIHHVTPVSKMQNGYDFDPLRDLVPVCSNCHSIIHRRKTPFTIEEIRSVIRK